MRKKAKGFCTFPHKTLHIPAQNIFRYKTDEIPAKRRLCGYFRAFCTEIFPNHRFFLRYDTKFSVFMRSKVEFFADFLYTIFYAKIKMAELSVEIPKGASLNL